MYLLLLIKCHYTSSYLALIVNPWLYYSHFTGLEPELQVDTNERISGMGTQVQVT